MPPKKSAKQAPIGTAAAATTSPFITRLTRQQLERLVQDSVNSGVAPTLASIKALLPLSLRSTEVKKVSVARGDERQVPT
jgi:molecular chaperone DnaK (HSP70)